MLMLTGHPSIQVGFAQSRQRLASVSASALVNPLFTSSTLEVALYRGSNSGICTRSIAVRSFGFIAKRNSFRHSALRSVSTSMLSFVGFTSIVMTSTICSFFSSICSICALKRSSSSFSAFLNVPIRLNISSQSTNAPSNSGPSMQTNRVFPPMVRRQAPHIPVPSTIIVLSETSVGILYFWVSKQQNFIMMGGPIAKARSTCS